MQKTGNEKALSKMGRAFLLSIYKIFFPFSLFLHHLHTSANTRYPMAAPSVFVTTSSSWQKPRSVKSCTVSSIILVANAAYTQHHHLRRNGTAAGSNAPNGRNSRIFSTKYRSGSLWLPQVSNSFRSTPVLEPGSLESSVIESIIAK